MPQNKNFQKRITILDECFSSRTGQFTLEKLIETIASKLEISVSRKTIQNDIKYVRETIENENNAHIDFDEFPVFIPKLFEGKKTIFKYSKSACRYISLWDQKASAQGFNSPLAFPFL